MRNYNSLSIGDISPDGSVKIIDQDRLCYVIQSSSRGAKGIRTISKKILNEFVAYLDTNNEATANNARESLCGKTEIDKFEYGYAASLIQMAKMILEKGIVCKTNADESLQKIYYGAPGTGKSHKIKEKLAGVSKEIFLEQPSTLIVIIQHLLERINLQRTNPKRSFTTKRS